MLSFTCADFHIHQMWPYHSASREYTRALPLNVDIPVDKLRQIFIEIKKKICCTFDTSL